MSRCADYFRFFKNGRPCHGNHKKREKFKVFGIGWNLIEMLYGMVLRLENFKMPAIAMETAKTLNLTQRWITTFWGLEISKWPPLPWKLFLNLQHKSFSLKSPTSYSVWQTSFAFDFMLIISSNISITGVVDDGRQLKPSFFLLCLLVYCSTL